MVTVGPIQFMYVCPTSMFDLLNQVNTYLPSYAVGILINNTDGHKFLRTLKFRHEYVRMFYRVATMLKYKIFEHLYAYICYVKYMYIG